MTYVPKLVLILQNFNRPLGRGVEHQLFGLSALYSNPLAEEERFSSSPALAGPIGNIESLGPVGGWG